MQPPFTIGFLGGCGPSRSTAHYFEQVVVYHLKTFSRIRFLLSLTTKGERSVASHLLGCRADNPGLEIAVVPTSRQWNNYQSGALGDRAAECNRIIAAADRCEILPESKTQLFQSVLFRFFIERCDHIIFHEHRAGWAETGTFDAQVVESGVPIPVQYRLVAPEYASVGYPLDRREYLDPESSCYNPATEYAQSTAYIRRSGFSIQSDHIPLIFLRKWLAAPPQNSCRYLTTPEDVVMMSHLKDKPECDYLSLKVFAYAYAARHTAHDMPFGANAVNRFRQFRKLLERIMAKRNASEPVEPFDLLDFDAYDEVLRTFTSDEHSQASECPGTNVTKYPRKRIRRTQFIKEERRGKRPAGDTVADSATATERSVSLN
ncbi:hypothetical protein [Bacteroides sp. 14(A)]|uniref:hypothetical protein n=1 Tax=Bacteroides sp. 14(A) TaxID=1163670 RepID=UPI0004785BBE|nr:hypothetical protein [Bacteroides sp. 14(A)]